jgi:DNA-binding PucR family transcriptional regulator
VALESLAIADRARAESFVTSELGPLHSADESWQRLAATLRCYLEHNARIRPTAQALGVHDNTIKNRIQAAAGALGRPVESRTAELLVALRLSPLLHARDRPPH